MFTLHYDTLNSVSAVALAADGRVAAGTSNGRVVLWHSPLDEPSVIIDADPDFPRSVLGLSFSTGDEIVATFDRGGAVVLCADGVEYLNARSPANGSAADHTGTNVAVYANGSGGVVQLWNVAARRMAWQRKLDTKNVGALAFDPVRRCLVTSGDALQRWAVNDGHFVAEVAKLADRPLALACSPDGRWLVAVFADSFRVWDAETGEATADVAVSNQMRFTTARFHPDGRLMTVGSRGVVQFWDPVSWTEAAAFEWRVGWASSCAISPDGALAAVGGNVGYVAVWDVDA